MTLTVRNAENIPDQEQAAPAAVEVAGTAERTGVQERFGIQRLATVVSHRTEEGRR